MGRSPPHREMNSYVISGYVKGRPYERTDRQMISGIFPGLQKGLKDCDWAWQRDN